LSGLPADLVITDVFRERITVTGNKQSPAPLIKLTAPGIPDIYQGAELWDLSYVDPDNRRSVDYTLRIYFLGKIKEEEKKGYPAVLDFIASHRAAGAEKLLILHKTLASRRKYTGLFAKGDYLPLKTTGAVLTYIRRQGKKEVLVIVPLIRKDAGEGIVSVTLPEGASSAWKNEFTGNIYHRAGNELELHGLFTKLPVALLTGVTE
jgi:(1->4)-alpha-D-glucan 1-alpha-D-glucosylmutase